MFCLFSISFNSPHFESRYQTNTFSLRQILLISLFHQFCSSEETISEHINKNKQLIITNKLNNK